MKAGNLIAAVGVVLIVACGKKDGARPGGQDSTGRDLSLAPVDTTAALHDAPVPAESTHAAAPAPPPAPVPPPATKPKSSTPKPSPASPPAASPAPAPAPEPAPPPAAPARGTRTAPAGATIPLTAVTEFSTKTHKVGQTVSATVASDVTDDNGRVVVPAGATVSLVITELAVSENKDDSGKVALKATQVSFGGQTYDVDGTTTAVQHTLKGRGVKAGDAAKVGAGAAAGAILGRVLSGKGKGAVVGGVIGAAAGTAIAINSADRDVIVAAGAKIVLKLKSALDVKA